MNELGYMRVTAHFLENDQLSMYYFATRVSSERYTVEYISETFLDILKNWDIPLTKIQAV